MHQILLKSTSGVRGILQQFFSLKTNFSQHKEEVTTYPVISILLWHPELNPCDVKIKYQASGMADYQHLEIGENHLHNLDKYNKTEKVFLQSLENGTKWDYVRVAYRILHQTPILLKNMITVHIQLEYYVDNKTISEWWYDQVSFFITSQMNSPGSSLMKWKDGKQMQIAMNKNNFLQYSVQPQIIKYLQENGECQEEPYYECIISQLHAMEFIECSKKCIPNVFSNLGKNYSALFCQNDNFNEKCIHNYMSQHEGESKCKRSCSNLEYFGEFEAIVPYKSEKENWNFYQMHYYIDKAYEMKVYEEYIIIDAIGMIGSVKGTF